MTAPPNIASRSQTVRRIHRSMPTGLILFGVVSYFVMVPNASPSNNMLSMLPLLLGVSLAACALAFVLSTKVPRPETGESADAFWTRAFQRAFISWVFLEGAGLLAIVVYSRTGSTAALAVAALDVFVFLLMNPAYFERR